MGWLIQHWIQLLAVSVQLIIAVVMFFGIYLAGKRFAQNHSIDEANVLTQFKESVIAETAAIKASAITWPDLDDHRKENTSTTERLHERIDENKNSITEVVREINGGISDIKVSLEGLTSTLNEHKNIPHKS